MNRWAIVTGASSGLGKEFARQVARGGYDLVIVARRSEPMKQLAREVHARYGTEVKIIEQDLSTQTAAEKVYEETKNLEGTIDILINNAGVGDFAEFTDSDWKKLQAMINLNILTLSYLTRLYAPGMAQRGRGHILNVASTAAFFPGPLMAVYYASKAYVKSFSLALAEELRGTGVSVTTLCPGPTSSGFEDTAEMTDSKLFDRRLPRSYEVAHYGYEAMLHGRGLVTYGWRNKLVTFLARFMPYDFAARFIYEVQKRKT